MKNKNTITKLTEQILAILQKEIEGNTVCLLDLPNYFNPGDQLIWEGEERLLKKLHINIKYRASYYFFNDKKISEKDLIVLHGGGNFGDLYPAHHTFKEEIVKRFPMNKIIVMPSTVYFLDKNKLKRSAKIFSTHSNVIICARDKNSYVTLKQSFRKNKIYLVPDSAFAIKHTNTISKSHKTKKVLFLKRSDREKTLLNEKSFNFIKNLTISDWNFYNQNSIGGDIHWWTTNINKELLRNLKKIKLHWNNKHDVYGLIKVHSREKQIKRSMSFLAQYDLIIATRLHGFILACLLRIPNIVLDNSYGKNKNFYDTWIKENFANSHFAKSENDVLKIMKKKFPEFIK